MTRDLRKKYEEATLELAKKFEQQLFDYHIYTLAEDIPSASDLVRALQETVHEDVNPSVPEDCVDFANWHALTVWTKAGAVLVSVKRAAKIPPAIRQAVEFFDTEGEQTGEVMQAEQVLEVRVVGLSDKPPTAALALFSAAVADVFVRLDESIVFEPLSTRLWTREQWERLMDVNEFDIRSFIFMHVEYGDEGCWVHTHGMKRFHKPDFEIVNVPEKRLDSIAEQLYNVAWYAAEGSDVQPGDTMEAPGGEELRFERTAEEHFHNKALRLTGHLF